MRYLLSFLLAVGLLAAEPNRALVFSKTAAFRHGDSIPLGNKLLEAQFKSLGLEVDISEDAAVFTPENLARYRVVAFMSTTGDIMANPVAKGAVLTSEEKAANLKIAEARQTAFQNWLEGGGAFVGVHAASDAGGDILTRWPWYAKMIGGLFAGHPAQQVAVLHPVDKDSLATAHLAADWKRKDEWYNFKNLQADNHVLLVIDETTYKGGNTKPGETHPMSWQKEVGKGRMFYTALGHTKESYAEPEFIKHVLGGILWTLRRTEFPK